MPLSISAAPGRAAAGDDLEQVGRQLGREVQLPRLERDQRRDLRRLEHDGVAGDQRHHRLAERNREREVPRRDHADHAARHEVQVARAVLHQVQRNRLGREDLGARASRSSGRGRRRRRPPCRAPRGASCRLRARARRSPRRRAPSARRRTSRPGGSESRPAASPTRAAQRARRRRRRARPRRS